jgi:hypothetical protein
MAEAENPQAGLKDRNLQDYYESMQAMFATKGWEYFIEDMRKLFEAADSVETIKNLDDLHFRRGQIDMIKLIVAQPAVIEKAYENLLAEDSDQ